MATIPALMGKKHGNIIGIYETTYGISSWKNQRTTLWLFNMAMENGPFIHGLPIKNGDFPWLC
jgi:hypothetical protein